VALGAATGPLWAGTASAETQDMWCYCSKCKGLFYAGESGGHCPRSGGHDPSLSYDYELNYANRPTSDYQDGWWHCLKCQGLHYKIDNPFGRCPAGGNHTNEGSYSYVLLHDVDLPPLPGLQYGWCHCKKCQGLHYGPEIERSKCPAGGMHSAEGTYFYWLIYHKP